MQNNIIRIIPKLDIKGPNLVKGVHLEGLRVLGKPEDFAFKYYQDGADELIYIDLVASLYGRSNLLDIVKKTAQKISIPLTVGGGVRSVDDMQKLLRAGADKIAINTALFETPELITEGAHKFGSQCMVLYIEAKKINGKYYCLHTNARENSEREVFEWAAEMVERGAGEILITSVDQEGTARGMDLELIEQLNASVPVPVIANGGAGTPEHMAEAAKAMGSGAICSASIFHYNRLEQLKDKADFEQEGNTSYIELSRSRTTGYMEDKIAPAQVDEVKKELETLGVRCRDGKRTADEIQPLEKAPQTVVVDYGMGNLFSLCRALENLGVEPIISNDLDLITNAEKVILPGVGAMKDAMKSLNESGIDNALRKRAENEKDILGICLGMQALMSTNYEFGTHECLGLIPGTVELMIDENDVDRAKLPHMGWNSVQKTAAAADSALDTFVDNSNAYFVHSYVAKPENNEHILGFTEYAGHKFCSVVGNKNTMGCQFHPELSGYDGVMILKRFLEK
ncbi:MAG: imidazole glycerol phosphate synthase subunit HisH [Desulfovibrio sp.]